MESVREMLVEQLRDLYDAEKQLVKALPKLAKTASNEQLKEAFEEHLEQTRGHVGRLEQAFEALDEKPRSRACAAMKGLIEEGKERMEEDLEEALMDSAIIGAAQKVEHYEIAGYGTVKAWARSVGLDEVADLLEATLQEEKEADQKLTEVSGDILMVAEAEDQGRGDAETAPRKRAAGKSGNGVRVRRRAG